MDALKKNYSLMPLHFVMMCGGMLAFGYLVKLTVKNPGIRHEGEKNKNEGEREGEKKGTKKIYSMFASG